MQWFAGGRVTGAASIVEMIQGLHHSVDSESFEGDLAQLSGIARQVPALDAPLNDWGAVNQS